MPRDTNVSNVPFVDRLSEVLSRATDFGLIGVLFVAPLFLGGRHPLGAMVYAAIVSLTAICWFGRNCLLPRESYRASWSDAWFFAAFLLLVLQLVLLPITWVNQISPGLSELMASDESFGSWSRLSMMPEATRASLVIFLAHAMLFVVVVQRCKEIEDIKWLIRNVAFATCAMAIFGLAQYLISNGKFFWIYEHPFRDTTLAAKGAFTNENHFAHFLALGIGPLVWMLVSAQRGEFKEPLLKRYGIFIVSILIAVLLFASLLSYSRGGVLVMLFAVIVISGLFAWKSLLQWRVVGAIAGIGVIAAIAVSIFGYDHLSSEIGTIGDLKKMDGRGTRRTLWQANVEAFAHFPTVGTGGGSHRDVYKTFFDFKTDKEFTHAESGYVQLLSEFGVAGMVLLAVAFAGLGYWCLVTLRSTTGTDVQMVALVAMTGLLTSALHSIWDFVWYIPSCMSIATIFAAVLCRAHSYSRDETAHQTSTRRFLSGQLQPIMVPRWTWALATVLLIATSFVAIRAQLGPALTAALWDAYVVDSRIASESPEQLQNGETNDRLIRPLTQILELNPNDARAHLKMSVLCLQRFDILQQTAANPLPFAAIHDAVAASNFDSIEARDDWLKIAVGDNLAVLERARFHAREVLRLSPLEGEAYLILAEVAFLGEHPNPTQHKQTLIEQALRVRPHNGAILAAAGTSAARSGDTDRAVAFWRKAFQKDRQQQYRLIEQLGPHTPPSFFLTQFEPDLEGLLTLYKFYQREKHEEGLKQIGRPLAQQLVETAKHEKAEIATEYLSRAFSIHKHLGEPAKAVACLERAIQISPGEYTLRRTLGYEAFQLQQYDKAVEHLRWCRYRDADDEFVQTWLENAHKHARFGKDSLNAKRADEGKKL